MEYEIHMKRTETKPEQVDFFPDQLKLLNKHFQELMEGEKLQGAGYLLARGGKIFAHRALGKLRPVDSSRSLLPDSLMRIASMTKLFTAVAVMQLVERGQIRSDQPVSEIIDEFDHSLFDSITIFHLLTHTSDLRPDPGVYFEPYPETWEWTKKENWIQELLRGHTRVEPGKEWRYSSAGFLLLGEIVSRVSGKSYEEFVRGNIFEPLGLEDTHFIVPEDKLPRVCANYCETDEELREKIAEWNKRDDGAPPGSTGAIYSTLGDMYKFGQMILNNGMYKGERILSRKSVERMTRNQLEGVIDNCWENEDVERDYGLGFRVQNNFLLLTPGSISHEGAGLSALYLDPEEELVFVLFAPLKQGIDFEARAVFHPINIVWAGLK